MTHFRFADDIVVMAETLEDLSTMLEDLNRVSQQVGLKMIMDKTEIMSNSRVVPTPVEVGNSTLQIVDQYIYLGQIVQLGKSNFQKVVNRRTQLGWAAFGKLRSIFSAHLPQRLMTNVRVASEDLINRDVAAYNGSYKEAQRHTEGNGKGYARGFST
jgi:hypothetical protein